MTGRADGQVVNEWPDYDQQRKAAERSVIDTLRTLHPDEREQVITAAQKAFPEPARISWSNLAFAVVVVIVAGLYLVRLDGLSELDRGVVAGSAGTLCLWQLYWFGFSVVDRIRRGDAG